MECDQTNIIKDKKVQVGEIQIADLSCNLYLPESYNSTQQHYPVIYINGEISVKEVINAVRKTGIEAEFLLLSIQPRDWNDDFTPWGAPAFRKGEEAPAGKADNYIRCLTEEIKPFMDANYRTKPAPEDSVLLGYSLGGLAALYACYQTELFGVIGSLSGSLWYDNFCEYMEQNKPLMEDLKVYLSLGRKECSSKNPRISKVADCTERAREILMRQLSDSGEDIQSITTHAYRDTQGRLSEKVRFEWNDGGHFHEIPKRFAKAIIWWANNAV